MCPRGLGYICFPWDGSYKKETIGKQNAFFHNGPDQVSEYHFPSVRMRCNARDIFMPMVAVLIPKDLCHFPLDFMLIHLNNAILVYQKNQCTSEPLMS